MSDEGWRSTEGPVYDEHWEPEMEVWAKIYIV